MCFFFSAPGFLLLPRISAPVRTSTTPLYRLLDVPGVILMIGALICFILGLTQGPIDGWKSISFIVPFVLFLVCTSGFFYWEYQLPPTTAILPRHVWKITNFTTSSLAILIPVGFWFTSQLLYATYWQVLFGWKPIHTSAAILPQGISVLLVGGLTQVFPQVVSRPRISLGVGMISMSFFICNKCRAHEVVVMIASVLQIYSYGGRGYDYWRYCFPA